MDSRPCSTALCLNLVLLALGVLSTRANQDEHDIQKTLVKRMDNIQDQLIKVTGNIDSLNSDLEKALQECLGIHSELCEAMEIEARMTDRRGLGSSWSPGKRSSADPDLARSLAILRELRRKKEVLAHIQEAFQAADDVMKTERKRSCQVNLGFHCDTEEISDFADMYDYLSSSLSPGKKRSLRTRRSAKGRRL